MAFSTIGSSESVCSRRKRLDGSELVSLPCEICFRRFQKKHISLGSLRLPWNVREVVRGMSFPLHFHIEEMRVIEYLLVKYLFVFACLEQKQGFKPQSPVLLKQTKACRITC
jgi:hypothetical protein